MRVYSVGQEKGFNERGVVVAVERASLGVYVRKFAHTALCAARGVLI